MPHPPLRSWAVAAARWNWNPWLSRFPGACRFGHCPHRCHELPGLPPAAAGPDRERGGAAPTSPGDHARLQKSEELAMHGNIVSAVSQFLTPDMVARMASASGISDRATAQTAVAAAVPAILSSLANLASKPDGERRLADAIAKQSPRHAGEPGKHKQRLGRSSRTRARTCCPRCSAVAPSVPLRAPSASSRASAKGRCAPSSACSLRSSWACSDAKPAPARADCRNCSPLRRTTLPPPCPPACPISCKRADSRTAWGPCVGSEPCDAQPIAALERAPAERSTP